MGLQSLRRLSKGPGRLARLIFQARIRQRLYSASFEPDFQVGPHIDGALAWIERAQVKSGGGGVSKGYDALQGAWAAPYPETTGYTIPTLLNVASVLCRPELEELAFSLADYLLSAATPEGGVGHWARARPDPIVFDTGQVIFGWLAAYRVGKQNRYLEAALRAGNWLVSIQDPSGSWKRFQHRSTEKVIDTRVAWALLELHQLVGDDRLLRAAEQNLNWALKQQDSDGWFRNCGFTRSEQPFTHTIAYAAEGLFESGALVNEASWVEAARLTADALMALQCADGRLTGAFGRGWRKIGRSSCLTGNCQVSRLWLRLFQRTGLKDYGVAARNSLRFVAATQELNTFDQDILGGISGSYPIYGRYERFKFPNWAAKFFVDALLMLEQLDNGGARPPQVG